LPGASPINDDHYIASILVQMGGMLINEQTGHPTLEPFTELTQAPCPRSPVSPASVSAAPPSV
jgi:hypothetical protein